MRRVQYSAASRAWPVAASAHANTLIIIALGAQKSPLFFWPKSSLYFVACPRSFTFVPRANLIGKNFHFPNTGRVTQRQGNQQVG